MSKQLDASPCTDLAEALGLSAWVTLVLRVTLMLLGLIGSRARAPSHAVSIQCGWFRIRVSPPRASSSRKRRAKATGEGGSTSTEITHVETDQLPPAVSYSDRFNESEYWPRSMQA